MKTSLLLLILLLSSYAVANSERKAESSSDHSSMAATFWPQDATVKVYFVRGLFTSEQRETLWRTLEALKQETETTSTNRFLYAGETGGLIDCLGCLTLTRHDASANKKQEASFNLLRMDQTGQLSSAWIGFDRAITDSQKLSRLLSRVLQLEKPPSR